MRKLKNRGRKFKSRKRSSENAQRKERLGLNSKNSSMPSSKELYKIKKDKQEEHWRSGWASKMEGSKGRILANVVGNSPNQVLCSRISVEGVEKEEVAP